MDGCIPIYQVDGPLCEWTILREKGLLTSSHRHLLILDGHKAHSTLDVLTKAKMKRIDMLTIQAHTSHGLQPFDVACFKPFKVASKAYK